MPDVVGKKPSFFAALRDLGLAAALARGGTPDEAAFEAVSDADDERPFVPLYQKLSAQGYAPAQYALACMYDFGREIGMNEARAARLYALAAAGGLDDAQFNLGMSYFSGEGVKPDMERAAEYFRMAAEQGYPQAINMLGVLCRDEYLPADDPDAAMRYFRRASELGSPGADFNLAMELLARDPKSAEAIDLLERAVESGVAISRTPENYPWGMREFNAVDLNGYNIRFGQHVGT